MTLNRPGRPRKPDRRRKNQGNCAVCGFALDSRRVFCNATCRKRAQRERQAAARALGGIAPQNRDVSPSH